MNGMIDKISVANRVVMITGAGQGIGRVYAREFARAGACVAIAELDAANASAAAAEITAAGGRALAVQTDVGSPESVRAATARITAELGPIEVLINNAAIFTALVRRPFDEIPFDWGLVRNFAIDDASVTETQQRLNRETFLEDLAILEQQQLLRDSAPST